MSNTTPDNIVVVDVTTRAISIPESEVNFGVAGDKNVETKHIRINGHVTASGLDLSQNFVWRVVGNNGGGGPFSDPIDITTLTSDGCIEMDWTPSPAAMARKGKLHFNVCGIEVDDSGVSLHGHGLQMRHKISAADILNGGFGVFLGNTRAHFAVPFMQ